MKGADARSSVVTQRPCKVMKYSNIIHSWYSFMASISLSMWVFQIVYFGNLLVKLYLALLPTF